MIKAHKIRLNPTPDQAIYFAKAAGTARFVYNWGLAAWKQHKEVQPSQQYGVMALKKDFNAIKKDQFPWIYEVAKDVAENAFIHLGRAFSNYYESKNSKSQATKVGFPRFKSKKNKRQSFHLNNDKIRVDGHQFYVPKPGWVNMAEVLRLQGRIMCATVLKQAGRWYVSISVDVEKPKPILFPKTTVGIDLGIKTLLVLSDGRQYENQVLLRSELKHLKRLSRQLSRRKKGSKRWFRAKDQLARFHERIANQRSDYLHKITTDITRQYALIGLEDLNTKGMLKNRHLALSLSDTSFGEISRRIQYKSKWYGGQVVKVSPFFPSSRLCGNCGAKNDALQLRDREWTCPSCGTLLNRDFNAARNIEVEAIRIQSQPR